MNSREQVISEEESHTVSGEASIKEQLSEELKDATTGGKPDGTDGPSLDLVFSILKNSRRRKVIEYLRQREERISMSDLTEHIAALENETT